MKKQLLIILTNLLCMSLAACNLVPPIHSDNSGSSESTDSTDSTDSADPNLSENSGGSESTDSTNSSDPNLSEKIYFPLEKEPPATDKKYIPSRPDYAIQIAAGDLNKSSHIKDYPDDELVSDPTQYTIQIGKKEFQAYHAKIWYGSNGTTHIFYNEDETMQYRISTIGNCFAVLAQDESSRIPFENDEFSEETLLNFIMNYVSSFVDIDNIDDYTYSCVTYVTVEKPQHLWTEKRDGFYLPEDLISEDSTEEVVIRWYEFDFVKYCNGYKTGDRITVECSADGDIKYFYYNDYGVNWNDYAVFTKPEQMNIIKIQIANYLPQSIDDNWRLKSFEPDEPKLVCDEGEVKLAITYHLVVKSAVENRGGAAGLCIVFVSIK